MSLLSPPPTSLPDSPYTTRKRRADDDDLDQRPPDSPLAKRFRGLTITPPALLTSSRATRRSTPSTRHTANHTTTTFDQQWNLSPPPFPLPSSPPPAAMDIDETPHRIYVHDLDASSPTSDDDERDGADENPIIFLSDVEREMSRIPLAVLKAPDSSSSSSSSRSSPPTSLPTARSSTGTSTDLILYRPPEELVDDGSVRRMIQQAKARIRMRADPVVPHVDMQMAVDGMGFTRSPESYIPAAMSDSDPDAMVLDDL
ncbi:hypothetical protein Dda_1274 [Drechslerella dactyloides]|uniref:Uncharacterized protein n=1 Tax=Drechslerella dactyloides TaxID=74499 RepID=A0AAD6NMX3_DREDA|nr:hypothetical protein Dda_1274 [Drechslerella dactyloides]